MTSKKCDICGRKKATINVTNVIGGEIKKISVCEDCSLNAGVSEQLGIKSGNKKGLSKQKPPIESICPNCLTTLSEFKRSGKFGCPKCYDVFKKEAEEFALKFHGVSSHFGASLLKEKGIKPDIVELKTKLDVAVKLENYEDAAKIRDQIRKMEKK